MAQTCNCGIPSKANWYVSATIVRDIPGGTETTEIDVYLCNEHTPAEVSTVFDSVLTDGWEIVDCAATELR